MPIFNVNGGVHLLMAAQFVSGLADNALLLVVMARVQAEHGPVWLPPLLKLVFTLSYVVLAPVVGSLADRWPKASVMGVANLVKAVACMGLAIGAPVLAAFCVAGAGAALYSPAKYGLVTELVPRSKLVAANGWIEVTTVMAILLGTVAGGALTGPGFGRLLDQAGLASGASLVVLLLLYGLAALLNLGIPDSGARYPRPRPLRHQLDDFRQDHLRLWRDPLGQVSLATTTLFWGVGATLQFLVLRWADERLGLTLETAAYLQGLSATGVVLGAWIAGRWITLEQAPRVLALGVLLGLVVLLLNGVHHRVAAAIVLGLAGALAGLFVVPMNALLQHRGSALLSAGRSIAVQNFNENASVLVMLGLYALCTSAGVPLERLILGFGLGIALFMTLVMARHAQLCRQRSRCPEDPPTVLSTAKETRP